MKFRNNHPFIHVQKRKSGDLFSERLQCLHLLDVDWQFNRHIILVRGYLSCCTDKNHPQTSTEFTSIQWGLVWQSHSHCIFCNGYAPAEGYTGFNSISQLLHLNWEQRNWLSAQDTFKSGPRARRNEVNVARGTPWENIIKDCNVMDMHREVKLRLPGPPSFLHFPTFQWMISVKPNHIQLKQP